MTTTQAKVDLKVITLGDVGVGKPLYCTISIIQGLAVAEGYF